MTDETYRPLHPRRNLALVAWVVGLCVAMLLDVPVYHLVSKHNAGLEGNDFIKMLRCGGYLPTWLIVAAALLMIDFDRAGRWCRAAWGRAAQLVVTLLVSGIANEVLKILFRRQRPDHTVGWYQARSFADKPFSSGGFSMPSSHAAIAFAAAFALSRLFPAARPVWIAIGVGVAAYRVIVGAHFVSDVYVAAIVASIAATMVDRWFVRGEINATSVEGVTL